MTISIKDARRILRRLGVKAHQVGDGRIFYGVPFTHRCGKKIPWVIVISSKKREMESFGAYCEDCRSHEMVQLDYLGTLALRSGPLLVEIEEEAARLEKELESNGPWFEAMIARTNNLS